MTDCV